MRGGLDSFEHRAGILCCCRPRCRLALPKLCCAHGGSEIAAGFAICTSIVICLLPRVPGGYCTGGALGREAKGEKRSTARGFLQLPLLTIDKMLLVGVV